MRTAHARVGILVAAALLWPAAGSTQSAGREPGPGQPSGGGTTLINSENPATSSGVLRLWRTFSTQGGRVMLKVFRPEGSRLVLVGTTPLVTVPPGEVVTSECSIPVSRNDLIGCFCPDATCVDRFADGVTLAYEGDAGTSSLDDYTSTVGSPAIWAGTSYAIDIPSTAGTDLVLPVAGRLPGYAGTFWTTSLELFNTATSQTTVALYFNLSEVDNTTPAASAQVVLPPRGSVSFDDLLSDVFQLAEEVTGSVDILALNPVIAHARIANIAAANGTYGQFVPAVPARWAIGDDDSPGTNPNSDVLYLFQLHENEAWRSNLGVVNVSGTALTVEVVAFDDATQVGASLDLELEPFSHSQVNKVLDVLGVPTATGGVRLNLRAAAGSAGRFLAYVSRVDNGTGDALFIAGSREASLPVRASTTKGLDRNTRRRAER